MYLFAQNFSPVFKASENVHIDTQCTVYTNTIIIHRHFLTNIQILYLIATYKMFSTYMMKNKDE